MCIRDSSYGLTVADNYSDNKDGSINGIAVIPSIAASLKIEGSITASAIITPIVTAFQFSVGL